VLAPTTLDTRPGAVKPINAFYTLRYTLPFLTVKFSVLAFQMGLQGPVETLPCPRHRWRTSQHGLADKLIDNISGHAGAVHRHRRSLSGSRQKLRW
jgi:hypothetical protein